MLLNARHFRTANDEHPTLILLAIEDVTARHSAEVSVLKDFRDAATADCSRPPKTGSSSSTRKP